MGQVFAAHQFATEQVRWASQGFGPPYSAALSDVSMPALLRDAGMPPGMMTWPTPRDFNPQSTIRNPQCKSVFPIVFHVLPVFGETLQLARSLWLPVKIRAVVVVVTFGACGLGLLQRQTHLFA